MMPARGMPDARTGKKGSLTRERAARFTVLQGEIAHVDNLLVMLPLAGYDESRCRRLPYVESISKMQFAWTPLCGAGSLGRAHADGSNLAIWAFVPMWRISRCQLYRAASEELPRCLNLREGDCECYHSCVATVRTSRKERVFTKYAACCSCEVLLRRKATQAIWNRRFRKLRLLLLPRVQGRRQCRHSSLDWQCLLWTLVGTRYARHAWPERRIPATLSHRRS